MSKVMLVANMVEEIQYDDSYHYIGIDKGSLFLLDHNINMDIAIGDFDSISENDRIRLKEKTKLIELNPIKDESDTEVALKYAFENYDEVILTGVIGGRIDHFLAIYNYLSYTNNDFTVFDKQNKIYKLRTGEHKIYDNGYKYLSFFPIGECVISLNGVKYPLNEKKVTVKENSSLLISNEIKEDNAIIEIKKGDVIVIQSRDAIV